MTLIENFNTVNQSIPVFLGHESFVGPIEKPSCASVEGLQFDKRCAFVKESGLCDGHTQFLNYIYLYYCVFNSVDSILYSILSYILIISVCMWYFLVVAITSDACFCPSLSVLGKLLNLNEYIAGLTLLSLGNSSPDFILSLSTISEGNPMLFTQIMGGAFFVSIFVGGIIITIAPFALEPMVYLRDALFLMTAVLLVDIFLQPDNVITAGNSIVIPLVYVAYIVVVLLDQRYLKRAGLAKEISFAKATFTYTAVKGTWKDLVKGFFVNLRVLSFTKWKKSELFGRILMLLIAPIMLALKLLIPIIDFAKPNEGWSKLLNCIQIVLLPLVIYYFFFHPQYIMGASALWFIVPLLLGFVLFVFVSTHINRKPKCFRLLIIYSVLGSIFVIWIFAREILNIVALIAILFRLSPAFVGCTLLSLGNCVGDLMSTISLASRGHHDMAFSATFGGPMFNILISLSLDFIYKSFMSPYRKVKVATGSLSVNCMTFYLIALTLSVFGITLANFVARRSLGIFLITFYCLFLLSTVLSHFEVIHAYGTNHNIDYRFQDGDVTYSFF